MGKTNVCFHVINSIKGGAGKSTFALLLANYLIQNDRDATIIDLDLQGSSWEENYNSFFEKTEKELYINNLMYLFSNEHIADTLRKIKVDSIISKIGATRIENHSVPIYISSPEIDRVDDVQADLFQNAIYRVINNIIENTSNCEINIILDMPPSKDRYAEVILTQLLLDINSPLYKQISSDFDYEVNLYMMTNITASHRDKNENYLKELARNRSFSDSSVYFIKNNKFKIYFIFNDVSNILNESNNSGIYTTIGKVKERLKGIAFSSEVDTSDFSKVWFLKHENFAHKDQVFKMLQEDITDDLAIKIESSTNTMFNEFMENLSD